MDASCERLNLLVSIQAKQQLERLAFCYGLTQRTVLERILAGVERATVDKLPADAHIRPLRAGEVNSCVPLRAKIGTCYRPHSH